MTDDHADTPPDLTLFALLEQADTPPDAPPDALESLPTQHSEARQDGEEASVRPAQSVSDNTGSDQAGDDRPRRAAGASRLLAALAAARTHGGEPLADAFLLSATDDQHDALLDELLDEDAQPPDAATTTQLSSGAQRALARIFGAPPVSAGTAGDDRAQVAYRRQANLPLRRVAEAGGAYDAANEQAAADRSEDRSDEP